MLSVALCGCTGSSADRGELEQRLRQVSKDARLETPVGGATFREAERVLCFPSEPPYVVFRYAYSGPFADVASFYRGLLARSGWRHDHPAEFEQRHDGWTARLFVEDNTTPRDPSDPVGYDLRVTVDDGVPARRKSWPGEQCGQSEWVPLVGDDAWQEFLGTLACYQGIAGDYDRAKIDAQAATEAARRVGSPSALIMAAHARAWAYPRDDLEFAIQSARKPSPPSRAAGSSPRTQRASWRSPAVWWGLAGDDRRALERLRRAIEIGRDHGTRPQLSAALDFCLRPLTRTGDVKAVVVFVGVLERGVLAHAGRYPGTAPRRSRALEEASTSLDADTIEILMKRGADLEYDDVVAFALENLKLATG